MLQSPYNDRVQIARRGGLTMPEANSTFALSPAEEKRIARELSPALAWLTLLLAAALPAAQWGLVGLGLARIAPLWLCAPILTFTAYAHYTLVHEAIHGNLAPGHARLRWLNTVVGWAGALALGGSWPVHLRSHVLHHAHTNTERDPDILVKGTLGQLVLKWLLIQVVLSLLPLALMRFLNPRRYRQLTQVLQGSDILQASAVTVATNMLLVASIRHGMVLDWLCLLFIPTRLAMLMLDIFFSWLPHHPFDRTERYLNTRISLWRGGTVLLLQQNLHLMHHLWPSVPFYNYARLYRRLRPTLVAKGSRIEGLMVGPYARDRSAA